MKNTIAIFTTILVLTTSIAFSQITLKEYKAGHVFYVNLPDYMNKTTGLNTSATIQFNNIAIDVAGIIIEDNKEDLRLAKIKYSSINDFYEDFIKDFLNDEDKRKVSKPQSKKVGRTNFIESDVSYYDKDSKVEIYYFVGIVETSSTFYKVLCWSSLEKKYKFEADFQKILYSIKD